MASNGADNKHWNLDVFIFSPRKVNKINSYQFNVTLFFIFTWLGLLRCSFKSTGKFLFDVYGSKGRWRADGLIRYNQLRLLPCLGTICRNISLIHYISKFLNILYFAHACTIHNRYMVNRGLTCKCCTRKLFCIGSIWTFLGVILSYWKRIGASWIFATKWIPKSNLILKIKLNRNNKDFRLFYFRTNV